MKKAFELLTPSSSQSEIDFKELETRFNIVIPPIYKLFCISFKLGTDSIYKDRFLNEKRNKLTQFTSCLHEQDERITLSNFYDIEESLESIGDSDDWLERAYIPIAEVGWNGFIVVCTKPSERDKVLLHDVDADPDQEYIEMADDVFEFVNGMYLEVHPMNLLPNNFIISNLYRNWGEDFWRVREKG